MTAILVDSNMLLDVLTQDPDRFDWSSTQLAHCTSRAPRATNPRIYAEHSLGFERIEELDRLAPRTDG